MPMAFEPPPTAAITVSGQPPLGLVQLRARLVADDALEIAHHRGIGVRPGDGADQVVGVMHVGDPVAHGVVHRILQRACAALDGMHLGTQQAHAKHVWLLPRDVGGTHVDNAFQAEQGTDRGGRDPMLAGAGLGDDPGAAHASGQQDLAHDVVQLVRAGVVQLLALEVDARTSEFLGQAPGEPERAWTADIILEVIVEVAPEIRIGLRGLVGLFQLQDQRHQRLGDETAAEHAEAAAFIRAMPETVGALRKHRRHGLRGCGVQTGLCAHRGSPIKRTS